METWVSYQKHLNRIKITSEKDTLPPDATFVRQYGDWNETAVTVCAAYLRGQGFTVCVEGKEDEEA